MLKGILVFAAVFIMLVATVPVEGQEGVSSISSPGDVTYTLSS